MFFRILRDLYNLILISISNTVLYMWIVVITTETTSSHWQGNFRCFGTSGHILFCFSNWCSQPPRVVSTF